MRPLTFKALRKVNVRRCKAAFHSLKAWSPNDWAVAVAGEVGEACNKLKKRRRGEKIPLKDIADEIADAVIYLDLLAARIGVNLGKAVVSKFNEVSIRRGVRHRL